MSHQKRPRFSARSEVRRKRLKAARMRLFRWEKKQQKKLASRYGLITEYDALIAAIVHRRKALGLSQLAVDQISGLPDGYQGKIECGMRNLGPQSFGLVLGALGLRFAPVPGETPRVVKARRRVRRRLPKRLP